MAEPEFELELGPVSLRVTPCPVPQFPSLCQAGALSSPVWDVYCSGLAGLAAQPSQSQFNMNLPDHLSPSYTGEARTLERVRGSLDSYHATGGIVPTQAREQTHRGWRLGVQGQHGQRGVG